MSYILKYTNATVGFIEVPNKISLCINISNCPCHCKGCHSSYLSEDIGTELTYKEVDKLLEQFDGINCISFMGGDINPAQVNKLAKYIKSIYSLSTYSLSICWYSGREILSKDIDLKYFNYIKLGPYIPEYGPLDNKGTNQRFYKVNHNENISTLEDITNIFIKSDL